MVGIAWRAASANLLDPVVEKSIVTDEQRPGLMLRRARSPFQDPKSTAGTAMEAATGAAEQRSEPPAERSNTMA